MSEPKEQEVDEFHGMGGSYVVGADGKRVLVERTKEKADEEAPAEAVPPSDAGNASGKSASKRNRG